MTDFSFKLLTTKGETRAGMISTAHGQIETPVFMPVGTLASVKSLDSLDVAQTQSQILLGNTYHLYLRPGMETMEKVGGLHQFMNWHKPILTDSGGFQVFSLAGQNKKPALKRLKVTESTTRSQILSKTTDEGVAFTSHYDGSSHFFTPEKSIQIQQMLGADIIMAFDECLTDRADEASHERAVTRTSAWASRCLKEWEAKSRQSHWGTYQALFGIIQGGLFPHLRLKSAQAITALPFDGFALGGETIGYNMAATATVMKGVRSLLPIDKPRYAMGLGRDPQDLIDAVLLGFDMFDCVGPTRLARNGALYFGKLELQAEKPIFVSPFPKGRLSIDNQEFASDPNPISTDCPCHTCQSGYSRAYLHHLYRTKELAYYRLASIHNVTCFVSWMRQMRQWILQ